jgi:hypothetical protein
MTYEGEGPPDLYDLVETTSDFLANKSCLVGYCLSLKVRCCAPGLFLCRLEGLIAKQI